MSRIESRNNEINSGGRGGGPRVQRGGSSIRGMGRGGGGERPLRNNHQDDNGKYIHIFFNKNWKPYGTVIRVYCIMFVLSCSNICYFMFF